jgi:hypothetical protein
VANIWGMEFPGDCGGRGYKSCLLEENWWTRWATIDLKSYSSELQDREQI